MKTDLTVAAYIFHEDKVLLIHHKKLGIWIPVGGHIEKDEVPDDALNREIEEEVGLKVEILNHTDIPVIGNVKRDLATPFYVNVHSVGDHDHVGYYYVCKALNPDDAEVNKAELKDMKWHTKEMLNEVPEDVKHQALVAFEIYEKSK